jgi:hypothetical protein
MLAHRLTDLREKPLPEKTARSKNSISVNVFHRGYSFDQVADSIMRVKANRLGRRLNDHSFFQKREM